MTVPTALEALPPSVGDAPVAALLLRDVLADLVAAGRSGGVAPAAVTVDDDGRFHLDTTGDLGDATDLTHAPFAAPELFRGAEPDGRSDVYAAACLALTRFLGTAPVAVTSAGHRPTAATRLGALRHAQRTAPARLGTLPDPFRPLFARAVAKERHLRPTPAALLADLDTALAAGEGQAAARTRVHRLVVLARVFESGTGSALRVPAAAAVTAGATTALHLPIRTLPALRPSRRAARVGLIAAVTVIATGGVAVAAVVGLSGSAPQPRPQALETLTSPTASPSVSRSTSPALATSSAAPAPATSAAPVETAPVGGTGNVGGTGGGSGYTGGSGGGSGGGSASTPTTRPRTSQPPAAPYTPPPTQPAPYTPPPNTPTPAPSTRSATVTAPAPSTSSAAPASSSDPAPSTAAATATVTP